MKKVILGVACLVVGVFLGYLLFYPTSQLNIARNLNDSTNKNSCNIQELQNLQKSLKEIPLNKDLATDWDFVNKIFIQKNCKGLDLNLEKACTYFVNKDLKGFESSKNIVDPFLYNVFKSIMEGKDYCGKNEDCLNQFNSIVSITEKKYLNVKTISDLNSVFPMIQYDLYKNDALKFQSLSGEVGKKLETCQKK